MSKPRSPTYKATNSTAYRKALKHRCSLTIQRSPEINWVGKPSGKRGRSRTVNGAAIHTCLTMKVLFWMALRQTTGFPERPLRRARLNWVVKDCSIMCRNQRTLAVNIPYRGAKGMLPILIDRTDGNFKREGDCNAHKQDCPKRLIWRNIHNCIDGQTLEIRVVEITGSNTGDAPMLPHLRSQVTCDQKIGSVTADGGCNARRGQNAIAHSDAIALIPPRKNTRIWKSSAAGVIARNGALRKLEYLSHLLWLNQRADQRRSRDETKIHRAKLLCQRLAARDFDRQVAEVQVRFAILNGHSACGIPVAKALGFIRLGPGEPCSSADLCKKVVITSKASRLVKY